MMYLLGARHCRTQTVTFLSEAQSWRKRNVIHQCSHEWAPASAHASAHASVHESAHKVGFLCVIIPYKGSHLRAHVSAHAGAHASVHKVVWSYVTWSVFTCSVPYPFATLLNNRSAPKELRRRRAQKRLSKRVFLESPFLLCPLKVRP